MIIVLVIVLVSTQHLIFVHPVRRNSDCAKCVVVNLQKQNYRQLNSALAHFHSHYDKVVVGFLLYKKTLVGVHKRLG